MEFISKNFYDVLIEYLKENNINYEETNDASKVRRLTCVMENSPELREMTEDDEKYERFVVRNVCNCIIEKYYTTIKDRYKLIGFQKDNNKFYDYHKLVILKLDYGIMASSLIHKEKELPNGEKYEYDCHEAYVCVYCDVKKIED